MGADPSKLTPVVHAETVRHSIVGLYQRPVRVSGLSHSGMGESKSSDQDGAPSPKESTNPDDLWEEKSEAQAKLAQPKLARHVRIGGARRKGSRREEGYIKPLVKVFSDVKDPGSLRPPELNHEQATLTAALVSATLEAPQNFDPAWRAIIGSHTNTLARSCVTLELTVLTTRKVWYDRAEKTLDPERLKYLSDFVGDDHLAYIRTTAQGECAKGGVSAACTIPEGTELEKRPSKRIRDLGDEAWNQY